MRTSPEDHPLTTTTTWQVKNHVLLGLPRRVPTVSVLFGALFQECVRNFTFYILLLQNTTIIKNNIRLNILESGVLTESDKLVVYKSILNNI